MYRVRRRGQSRFFPLFILFLFVAGSVGFLLYKAQGTVISMHSHPTVVVEQRDCSGAVHVRAGSSDDKVILQGLGTAFTSYERNDQRNLVIINACDLTIVVPVHTDLVINADAIDVYGVKGQMTLDTNGGVIAVWQSTLQSKSTLSNNGGPIRFNGSLDPGGSSKFDSNGGLIDLGLSRQAVFHLDVTGITNTITTDFPGVQLKDSAVHVDIGSSPTAILTLDVNDSPIVLKGV